MSEFILSFDDQYFEKRLNLIWRAVYVREAVEKVTLLTQGSLVDVGCSVGEFVNEFQNHGWSAYGVDGSEAVKPHFIPDPFSLVLADLRKPLKKQFQTSGFAIDPCDVVLCFEVGESGFFRSASTKKALVRNLKLLTKKWLFFAVAEELQWVWTELLANSGFRNIPQAEEQFRSILDPLKRKMAMRAIYYGTRIWERVY